MKPNHSIPASNDDTWRVFRIMAEFVEGFETLSRIGPCVTIFGSARTPSDHEYYRLSYQTATHAVSNGYGVITGGGPGIMEAANKGALDAGGTSVGLNIQLPYEQVPNPFIKTLINFRHFFSRKVMFLKYTSAVIAMPGGYGTMDEVFETLTLIQTQKAKYLPLILMGSDYWNGLLEWLEEKMLGTEYIDSDDVSLMKVIDDPEEAISTINDFYKKRESDVNFV
ncbi:MAG: TIGR00730 family Rossman fold protein [Fibrobacterota bacterium]